MSSGRLPVRSSTTPPVGVGLLGFGGTKPQQAFPQACKKVKFPILNVYYETCPQRAQRHSIVMPCSVMLQGKPLEFRRCNDTNILFE